MCLITSISLHKWNQHKWGIQGTSSATSIICVREFLTLSPFHVFVLVLMLEPVIEGKATDHALFCKYAGELLERVTGKTLATSTVVRSLSRITKVFSIFLCPLRQEIFIPYCSEKHPFISSFCPVYCKFCCPLGLETALVSLFHFVQSVY